MRTWKQFDETLDRYMRDFEYEHKDLMREGLHDVVAKIVEEARYSEREQVEKEIEEYADLASVLHMLKMKRQALRADD